MRNSTARLMHVLAISMLVIAMIALVQGQAHDQIASIRPIGGPSNFVCKTNCGYYGSTGNLAGFERDRCCTFIQCPYGPTYNKYRYEQFRRAVCFTTQS